MEQQPSQEPVRLCGYRGCRAPLPPVPPGKTGRPPAYCTDGKTWPPSGKTCREMAQAERAATAPLGLEAPLATYHQAVEETVPALLQVRDRLDRLIAAGENLDADAMARVTAAEVERGLAIERAETAETQAQAAQGRAAEALRQAKADKEARTVAERLARDAERDRDEQVRAAWARVVDAEAAKGVAEGKAAEATANLRAYIERYDDLARRNNDLRETHGRTERELSRTTASLAAAERTITELRTEIERRVAAAEKVVTAHHAAIDELRRELQTRLEARLEDVDAQLRHAHQHAAKREAERDMVIADLERARTTITDLTGRAARLEAELAILRRGDEEAGSEEAGSNPEKKS